MTLDLLLRILSTAATLIIGVAASFLAYQQYRISKAKLKLDLYERRLDLFKVAHEFALKVLDAREGSQIFEAAEQFRRDDIELYFLFDDREVLSLFADLYQNAMELSYIPMDGVFTNPRGEYLRDWFNDQTIMMPEAFRKQLSIKSLD